MSRIEPHDRVLVLGKTGSGKSNKAKALLAGELEHGSRIVVFDPHDEYSQEGRKSAQIRLGPLRDRCTVDELVNDPGRLDSEDLSLAVVPAGSRLQVAAELGEVAELVRETGNLLFVVEECGYISDHANNELEDLACQDRHRGVALMLVAQCAVQIPKIARRQASQLWSGRQDDPDDLRAIEKICGDDFAARVRNLQRGELLHWKDSFASGRDPARSGATTHGGKGPPP